MAFDRKSRSSVWNALARLLRSWWSVDRVRAAQREGRILRLRPPATLGLAGREIEVVGRSVEQGAAGAFVIYDCQTNAGPAQLRVSMVGPYASPRLVWLEQGRSLDFVEDDFEIWEAIAESR